LIESLAIIVLREGVPLAAKIDSMNEQGYISFSLIQEW